MKRGILACVIVGAVLGLFSNQIIAPTSPPDTQISPSSAKVDTSYGWWLKVPEIGLQTQMSQTYISNNTIPAPSGTAGYFNQNAGNIFIVGHRSGVFSRLGERPSTIYLEINGKQTEYHLQNAETKPKEQVDMNYAINYQGVVLMTCDGTPQNEQYPDRLTLYYR